MIQKIFIFIGIILIFYFSIIFYSQVYSLDFNNFDFKLEYYLLIIPILTIHTLLYNFRFYRLLHKLKIKISYIECLKISLAGMSLGLTPGGIGTAVKSHIIKNKFGNSITSTLPVIFIERITELIGIIFILFSINLIIFTLDSIIVSIIGLIFITLFFLLVSRESFFKLFQNIFMKVSFLKKLSLSIYESRESLAVLLNKKTIFESILYTVFSKFLYLIAIYYIFLSFGIDLGIITSGSIYYTSLLIGTLSFIPAGMVITESSMLVILSQYGVEFSLATIVVITLRIVGTWILSLFGIFTYIIFYRKNL